MWSVRKTLGKRVLYKAHNIGCSRRTIASYHQHDGGLKILRRIQIPLGWCRIEKIRCLSCAASLTLATENRDRIRSTRRRRAVASISLTQRKDFHVECRDYSRPQRWSSKQRCRWFTTESSDDEAKTKGDGSKKKSGQPIKKMEPDFARYLTGEMESPVETTKKDAAAKKAKRKRNQAFTGVDPDRELYAQIRRVQTMQKERARLKTATNVYRALCGNVIICIAKFGAWVSSGSSGMLSEFIHSVVDCGNQGLLLIGLRDSRMVADRKHPYGYGKSVYFWALVSALGTFFLGAGVSMTHAIGDLMNPSLHDITWQVWAVLGLSLTVDGYVLSRTIADTMEGKPKGVSYWKHVMRIRDPATLAVLLEDGAACLGVVFACGGIVATHVTGNPIFDGVAGVGISALLGAMGIALVRTNHRFLLGRGVDREIIDDIEKILLSRRSIDSIGAVKSQWTGPETFSYKAEVDFDGTYLAAKLMPIYQGEFLQIKDTMDDELQVLLALYAEDVMRQVEREVRHVEAQIRKRHPGAEFIELEPMSMDADRLAIDDNIEAELRRVESDALNRYLKTLKKEASMKEETKTDPNNDPSSDKS